MFRGLVSGKGPCQWYLIMFLHCFGLLRSTLRDRICDFGNGLDSCKGLVRAIYSVLPVARGFVSGNGALSMVFDYVFAMVWTVVKAIQRRKAPSVPKARLQFF